MPFSVTQVEGPPGSGKSRFLAREAIRLMAQEGISTGKIRILAMGNTHKNRLAAYLQEEAKLAGLEHAGLAVTTLDEWLLGLLNQSRPQPDHWRLLTELQAQTILSETLRRHVNADDELYYASQRLSLSRIAAGLIRQCQLQGITPQDLKAKANGQSRLRMLAEAYETFQTQCERACLLTYPALVRQIEGLTIQHPEALPQVILIDEAQELSGAHYRFLSGLPVSVVLAGNEKLGIRSHRGGQPELFRSFFLQRNQPVTAQVQQACMRGNTAILSLLNGFLPQPVWEEQSPDLAQLESLVKFGYYGDPEAEALALADQMNDFVARQFVGDRPATWEDCVVLLRSSRYKADLRNALLQKEIPFRDDELSEIAQHFQRDFFALLNVLAGWEKIGLRAEQFTRGNSLSAYLEESSLYTPDKAAFIQSDNRYLTRWLEAALHDGARNEVLQYLRASSQDDSHWRLPQWLDEAQSPPAVVAVLRDTISMYGGWQTQGDPLYLTQQAMQALSAEMTPADDSPDASLSLELERFQNGLGQLAERYRKATGESLRLATLLEQYESLWSTSESGGANGKGVRLMSIHQAQGEEFPWVAIPFLVSDEFPNRREVPELLASEDLEGLGADLSLRLNEAEEKRLFAVGASRATHQLVLSCHRSEGTEAVLPSPFYAAMLAEKRRLLNQPSQSVVCWCETGEIKEVKACEIDFCGRVLRLDLGGDVQTESLAQGYTGDSVWASLPPQEDEPVFAPDFELTTSPTAISNYMKCPRQYYYKHLLGLPEAGNVAASLGTLVHKVMEAFNSQTQVGEYTPECLAEVAEALFDFEENPNRFYFAGFGEREKRTLSQMSPLSLSALKARLLASIEDLKEKGYFDRYGTLKAVQAEKDIKSVAIEGIERCRFKGKMDAAIQLADGRWEIIDYKTYGNSKYGANWELCEQNFQKSLEPLPHEEGLPHQERFADKMSASYPIDYQLPLYYLACREDAAYEGKFAGVSLQLVRPQFPKSPHQGSIRLAIPAEALEAAKDQLTADIQAYVVNPILESQHFEAVPTAATCGYCAYAGICEMGQTVDEPEESA